MQHSIRIPNGIMHYSSVDAIFRKLSGEPIAMEFHHYCGPFFLTKDEEDWLPKEDSLEWVSLWKQFYGWWEAKGKTIYITK